MSAAANLFRRCLRTRPRYLTRRGNILILAAILMIVMMGMLALSVDVGYIATVKNELSRATDAAALAGAGALIDGQEAAQLQAFKIYARNPVGSQLLAEQENWEELAEQWIANHPDEFRVQVGHWDPDAPKPQAGDEDDPRFLESDYLPSTIRVQTVHNNAPLFFGRLFDRDSFSVRAESIARFQPRDIVLVLDFSASMNDDSELGRISDYGESARATVEQSLAEIYSDLGSPTYGNMQFAPQYIYTTDNYKIKQTLGLLNVPYPYARGSWDEYINYVKSSGTINGAGYRKKYGYLTLVNYWLESRPMNSETVDLWKVRAQPIASVKDAVGVFMDYIQEVDCDDRVGLAIYNSPSQTALIEHHLTEQLSQIEDTVQHRQAGHYDQYTNIGAGIREGRLELDANARVGAKKMIVLMTDGIANRPSGTSEGRAYALQQAAAAAASDYPIVTISLGSAADTVLMQQIADATDGVHFNIPGGESVTNYWSQLLAVFRQIADDRPLMLVK